MGVNVSDLRKAAQQALEALKNTVEHLPVHFDEHFEAIEALKSAIAQPEQEPDMRHPKIQRLIGSNARRNIEMSLIEQLLEDPDCELSCMDMEYWGPTHDRLREKLLATPPQRKPLTDEEMRLCFTRTNTSEPLSEGWPGLERFARAIEKAHGIGEDK